MTAFFVWIEKGSSAIDRQIALSMLGGLAVYGGDRKDLLCAEKLAIGVQQKWSTSEDVGEIQPVIDKAGRYQFVFDGRIDNRSHLINELQYSEPISDAKLLFDFILSCGEARLPEVIGPFSFVLFDLMSGSLVAARDVMGGRNLVMYESKQTLLIASTEVAFLHYPEVGNQLNDKKVAASISLHSESNPSAFLENVIAIKPGDKVRWNRRQPGKVLTTTFYRTNPERRIRYDTEQEYAAEFRRLFDQAVKRRLRTNGGVGVMLSGGLDSAPMAISAAMQSPQPLIAYSWVFDENQEEDERQYSVPLCERFGLKQRFINCDDLWPRFDESTFYSPFAPFSLPYSEYHLATYREAQRDDIKVMLHGVDGDLLYETGGQNVLDALVDLGVSDAYQELKYYKNQQKVSWWAAVKTMVFAKLGFVRRWRDNRNKDLGAADDILNETQKRLLNEGQHWLADLSRKAARPAQFQLILDAFSGEGASMARSITCQYGYENRHPFRDRDLCEYMLAIPTRFLEALGQKRPVCKAAFEVEFEENLRKRNDKTKFIKCLQKGIERDVEAKRLFNSEPKYWEKYVKDCYFDQDDVPLIDKQVVKWRCAYYNFWVKVGK